MITRFHIENFKSLADFDLPPEGHELAGFTCLIGMNGAGKTTLLQAFDFTAQLMRGRVEEWLESREWDRMDLATNLGGEKRPSIQIAVDLTLNQTTKVTWTACYHSPSVQCVTENITEGDEMLLSLVSAGSLTVAGRPGEPSEHYKNVPFEYEGSVLSTLNLENAHPLLNEVKRHLISLRSLELLAPQLMRRSSRESEDIGSSGERLTGFLAQLSVEQRDDLRKQISRFYPQVQNWRIRDKQFGWKGLLVKESTMGGREVTEAHINDGFLRVIAMLSQAYTGSKILLLDEVENGINPAIADELMDFLVSLSREGTQVIVTTHSPVVLNYLEDDVAKAGVILLFKSPDGRTQSRRYFDVPENERKLRALGPGEVFLDTSIEDLVSRLAKEATPSEAAT
ncbi:MAG TPA: AAA family ATPase [Prosthecobacter sp.]